jgi:hypothetical protein
MKKALINLVFALIAAKIDSLTNEHLKKYAQNVLTDFKIFINALLDAKNEDEFWHEDGANHISTAISRELDAAKTHGEAVKMFDFTLRKAEVNKNIVNRSMKYPHEGN